MLLLLPPRHRPDGIASNWAANTREIDRFGLVSISSSRAARHTEFAGSALNLCWICVGRLESAIKCGEGSRGMRRRTAYLTEGGAG